VRGANGHFRERHSGWARALETEGSCDVAPRGHGVRGSSNISYDGWVCGEESPKVRVAHEPLVER